MHKTPIALQSLGCLLVAHTALVHPESACSAPGDFSTVKQGDLWVGESALLTL